MSCTYRLGSGGPQTRRLSRLRERFTLARARSIKPGFFTNEDLAEVPPLGRILFAGLWTLADREGRLEDRPNRIKVAVLPYDSVKVENLLGDLSGGGFIVRYESNGKRYIAIPTWHLHQNPHHMEAPSDIPAPEGSVNRFNHKPLSPKQRARVYARDGRKCKLCGATENLQIDHIDPVSQGGSSSDDNLRTLCGQCNNKRSKSPPMRDSSAPYRADSLNPEPITLNPEPLTSGTHCPTAVNGAHFKEFIERWQSPCGHCQMVFPCNQVELGFAAWQRLWDQGMLTQTLFEKIMAGLDRHRASQTWHKGNGQYVMAVSTFLGWAANGLPAAPRWNDHPAKEEF